MRYNENYNEKYMKDIKFFNSTVESGHHLFREHHHTECEFTLCIGGSGIYSVKGREYYFKSGDIFFFASNEVHCITEADSGEPLKFANVQFEPKILWEGNPSSAQIMKLYNNRSDNFSNKIYELNPATEIIKNKILTIGEEFKNELYGFELKVRLEIFDILLLILRNYNYVKSGDDTIPDSVLLNQLSNAINYIEKHLSDEITLDAVAKSAMLSKTYFSTLFKKYNGLSVWDYITIKRVEKAIKLLETGKDTKLSIAHQCGFSTSSNFYKAFKKVTGKTPSSYTSK